VYDDDSVEYGGKVVGGVRLRAVPAKAKAKAKAKKSADLGDEIPF
jgi:hypothetical protein